MGSAHQVPPRPVRALRAEIQKIHTYEVPEVIALPIVEGSEAYLGWLDGQLTTPGS